MKLGFSFDLPDDSLIGRRYAGPAPKRTASEAEKVRKEAKSVVDNLLIHLQHMYPDVYDELESRMDSAGKSKERKLRPAGRYSPENMR